MLMVRQAQVLGQLGTTAVHLRQVRLALPARARLKARKFRRPTPFPARQATS